MSAVSANAKSYIVCRFKYIKTFRPWNKCCNTYLLCHLNNSVCHVLLFNSRAFYIESESRGNAIDHSDATSIEGECLGQIQIYRII